MTPVKFTTHELYDAQALIMGFKDSKGNVLIPGFVNESNAPEATKRAVYRSYKAIKTALSIVDEQRLSVANYTQEGLSDDDIIKVRKQKDDEIVLDPTPISVPVDLIDFKSAFKNGESLSYNYQFLYEKLFKD